VATLTEKKVTLVNKVDPAIIGGFILRLDDIALNASVAHQLNSLKQTLRSNAISWQK
jgi:F-type H+-transporting ATPase subunit delta